MQNSKQKQTYFAKLVDNIEFSEDELRRMGIFFMDSLENVQEGLNKLNIEGVRQDSELVDHGYTLALVGPLNNTSWALYSVDLTFEFVSDVWNKKNFYTITRQTENGSKVVFNKVHLRDRKIEEDMSYYIELDLSQQEQPYEVFSEYVH